MITKIVRDSLFRKIKYGNRSYRCKISKSRHGQVEVGYVFEIAISDDHIQVVVLDILDQTPKYYKVSVELHPSDSFFIEYYGRHGCEYSDIYAKNVTYGELQATAAEQLSEQTDLPMIYFLMCPLTLYLGYYEGSHCPNLREKAEPLDNGPDGESLMLGDSQDDVEIINFNIDNIVTNNILSLDEETLARLVMAKIIFNSMANPYSKRDIKDALIKTSDAVMLLDTCFLVNKK